MTCPIYLILFRQGCLEITKYQNLTNKQCQRMLIINNLINGIHLDKYLLQGR